MAGYRETAFQSQALNKNGIKTPPAPWTAKKNKQKKKNKANMRNLCEFISEVNRYEQKGIWAYKWSLLNRNVLLH